MAADYDRLHQLLAKAILEQDAVLTRDTAAFVRRFLAYLPPQAAAIPPSAEIELTRWLSEMTGAIRPAIAEAIAIGATAGGMTDHATADLAAQMYERRWPNGVNLSQRLWRFRLDAKAGIEQALQDGIRQMQGVNSLVYDMQRAIERSVGTQFDIVSRYESAWVEELTRSALTLIHDPGAKSQWVRTVADIRKHINQLAETGTRSASERIFSQVIKAVKKGNAELVADAVHWWVYDQQLYDLKRIARTEMANAGHAAIIESTQGDESIIGYQWRLSGSHPRPDICDWYANIDMGLGRGVWTKDAVPRHKAHPHCMCLIVPRVTPVKDKGSKSYAEFVRGISSEKRAELLPKWANRLNGLGVPLEKLTRPDGLGLVAQADLAGRMGENRLAAAETLGRALTDREWGLKNLGRDKKKTARLLDALMPLRQSSQEVAEFIRQVQADPSHVDSRALHYIQRRYQDQTWAGSADELDDLFSRVVSDKASTVHRKGGNRYQIRSKEYGWIAIIEPNGTRVSIYPDLGDDLGDTLWTLQTLTE